MKIPELSIVVISFNCWNLLDACLRSLDVSPAPVREIEIIVIDNASVDGTPQKLREVYPQVTILENHENIGHPRAVNQGMAVARGELIMILDADTEFKPDAISHLLNFLGDHPEVSMVTPRTLNPDGTIQETARNFPTVINGLIGRQSFLSRWFPHNRFIRAYLDRNNLEAVSPFRVEFISAACMMFRRKIIAKIGIWDEGFQGYWVDADWCMRFKENGEQIYCLPQAIMIHHEQNKAFKRKSPKRIVNFHRGVLRFYRLHYTSGYFDPRWILAAVLLFIRTLMLLVFNLSLRTQNDDNSDPLSLKKERVIPDRQTFR